MSAWQGWRPLYRDPKAPPGAPVSRHHAIGTDPNSGVTFICGGKWSTYRAMAEELIDKVTLALALTLTQTLTLTLALALALTLTQVIEHKGFKHATACSTKKIKLLGGEGYHDLLHVQLVQKYGTPACSARTRTRPQR